VPDAERCRKASREGTSRCSEPEAGDKPGYTTGKDTRRSRYLSIDQQGPSLDTCNAIDTCHATVIDNDSLTFRRWYTRVVVGRIYIMDTRVN